MTKDDLEIVCDIEKLCFSEHWRFQSFEESLDSCECFILSKIDLSDEIVGYFIGLCILDEYEILNIALKPEYQKKGLGFYLVSQIIENHKKKYSKYFLEVRKNNLNAISMYKKLGFKYLYERKNYYFSPQEDALVMSLELN